MEPLSEPAGESEIKLNSEAIEEEGCHISDEEVIEEDSLITDSEATDSTVVTVENIQPTHVLEHTEDKTENNNLKLDYQSEEPASEIIENNSEIKASSENIQIEGENLETICEEEIEHKESEEAIKSNSTNVQILEEEIRIEEIEIKFSEPIDDKEEKKPPVPIKTYYWEEVRRSKEQVKLIFIISLNTN